MKKVKGILLKDGMPQVVEFENSLSSMKELLEVEWLEHAVREVGGVNYDFWFDEEFLLNRGNENLSSYAVCVNAEEYLCHNILITNSENEDIASLTNEDIKRIFGELLEVKKDMNVGYRSSIGHHIISLKKGQCMLIYKAPSFDYSFFENL